MNKIKKISRRRKTTFNMLTKHAAPLSHRSLLLLETVVTLKVKTMWREQIALKITEVYSYV